MHKDYARGFVLVPNLISIRTSLQPFRVRQLGFNLKLSDFILVVVGIKPSNKDSASIYIDVSLWYVNLVRHSTRFDRDYIGETTPTPVVLRSYPDSVRVARRYRCDRCVRRL